ncbi:uncharacterized protein BT62DRAFT_938533 [Guyanagaster necrorhizus]|uniref:Uncharacterized protein n=1 Tax=Guyanagaster necrorhizus TaxID=856835 RepID=A0A9P8AKW0_9AGAR|nr:uncharacterized protein BT62DRAFT_939288 [Guyanagaster necrorhizus MCA 3950]XP_043033448.1 uncharacterized protein BT62DRAFT_938533 [Guyanagaster necrorhizus MCA 3950]KAG7439084.1 hypothetical protein BT62DRAFT_939288 [Guyanagaster necrorhizus MCA 3950]KAG7439948.1 hypothetical protein BT62DRAFT_938533 [Guyanagaster necrorhizus MCA 3950]
MSTPKRMRYLYSLSKKPIFYHLDGKGPKLKPYKRMLFPQEDEWAASVAPFSVECKAFGASTALGPSQPPKGYDRNLWMRHITRCLQMYVAWLKRNGEGDGNF